MKSHKANFTDTDFAKSKRNGFQMPEGTGMGHAEAERQMLGPLTEEGT